MNSVNSFDITKVGNGKNRFSDAFGLVLFLSFPPFGWLSEMNISRALSEQLTACQVNN